MANPRVQAGSLFYKGRRVGVLQGFTYTFKTNDTQEVADAGVFNTDGIETTEITADNISPITGLGISVIADALAKRDLEISLGLIDGKIHSVDDARLVQGEWTGEKATGKQTNKLQFHAGKPKIVG